MITQEYLRLNFVYDANTGIMSYKNGQILGKNYDGYLNCSLNGIYYGVHRLIWLYVHGYMPQNYIDHINGNRSDNRLCNLREATNKQNQHNAKLRKDNTSGIKGVSWNKKDKKWNVQLKVDKKIIHIGRFNELEQAKTAISEARRKYHGEFSRDI